VASVSLVAQIRCVVLRHLKDLWTVFWIVTFLGLWLFYLNLFFAFGIGTGADNKTDFFSFFIFGPMPLASIWFCPLLYPIYGALLVFKQRALLLGALIFHHAVWLVCLFNPGIVSTDLKPSISAAQLNLVLTGSSTYITLLPPYLLIHGLLMWHALVGQRSGARN
jgi:hypothetical protein